MKRIDHPASADSPARGVNDPGCPDCDSTRTNGHTCTGGGQR